MIKTLILVVMHIHLKSIIFIMMKELISVIQKNKEFLEYIDAFNSEKFIRLKCKVFNFYKNKKDWLSYSVQFERFNSF